MGDLVTQLRELSEHIAWLGSEADLSNVPELLSEVADRIEQLEAERDADLFAALERIKREARNEALRAAAECCTAELRNTAMLLSNPPQSSAAWDAKYAILALMEDTPND